MPKNSSEQGLQEKIEELELLNARLTEERNLLRALVDNYPDSIYAKDIHGRKVLANQANVRNMGFQTETEIIGKSDVDMFMPEIAAKLLAEDQRVLQGESLLNHEERLVKLNGEVYWMLTTKVPWRDARGKIIGIIGGGRNITKQKEIEAKLVAERNLLRAVIDNLPDAVYVKDAKARKLLANPSDLRNLRCKTEAEAIGKTDYDFFPKETAEKFFEDDQMVLKKGQSVIHREEKAITSAGEEFWLLTTKIPWRDAHGNIIGLVGIGRNITDKKNLEMQLLRAQRMESIGRLATGIAHDLNNILAPILISTSLLREKIKDEDGMKMLSTVEASAKRGADVVKQVLLFGRGVEGQRISINLKHFMKEIAKIATDAFGRSIQVDLQIGDSPYSVMADPSQLHQVFLNLCFNARDAMPMGGKLTLSVNNFTADVAFADTHVDARVGNYVILEVADTGRGISRENLDRLFEPFFTTKEIGKGAGLALSTVMSTIKSHEGFILVDSEIGKGSTFRIYLPAQSKQTSTS